MTWHAIDRARERLGLELTPADIAELHEMVHRGRAVLQADRGQAAVYLTRHARSGRLLSVVIARDTGSIVTVLHPRSLSPRLPMPVRGRRRQPRRMQSRLVRQLKELTG